MQSLALLADIYRGITEPHRWVATLDRVLERFEASGAIILSVGPSQISTTRNFYGSTFSLTSLEQFEKAVATRDRDLVSRTLEQGPHRAVLLSELIPQEAHRPLPVEALAREIWGTRDVLLAGLSSAGGLGDVLALHYRTEVCSRADARGEPLRVLLPHLGRAVEMTRPFQILRERHQGTLDALDHLRLGVFILDTRGYVVLRNARADAFLDERDGLMLGSTGRLTLVDRQRSAKFERDLAALSATSNSEGTESSSVHAVPRRSGAPGYVVELSPLRIGNDLRGVLAFVADPGQSDSVCASGLAAAFGLSASETKICTELIRGSSNRRIGDALGRSPETVKSVITRLLKVTGATNRTDLVRLALSAHWPVDHHGGACAAPRSGGRAR